MIALYIVIAAVVVAVGLVLFYALPRRRGSQPERSVQPRPAAAPQEPTPPAPAPAEVDASVEGAVDSAAAKRRGPVVSLKERLSRPRGLFGGIRGLRSRSIDAGTWETLEETLLRADVGVKTVEAIVGELRERARSREISSGEELLSALRDRLVGMLSADDPHGVPGDGADAAPAADGATSHRSARGLRLDDESGVVNVWLFVGVNGVGKTTTIGKVAMREVEAGRRVLLAAGDTFRAAAAEQLTTWAGRAGVDVVRGAEGGDPSAVVFDAVQRAGARGVPLVLADTAGRLHTKVNLVEELKKIRRVADRPPGRVTEVLLVLDATTGQNGLEQARQFTEAVRVTGVVLTKLDGTAKGGIVVAIHDQLGLPVKLVGVGESVEDLVEFVPEEFVDALLA